MVISCWQQEKHSAWPCSAFVFYFFSKNLIFLLAQSPQGCSVAGKLSPSFHPTSSPTSSVCSLLIPAASQLDAAVKKILTRLGKEDFRLGARKRDSSKRGKLPKKGFVPGCGAADVLVGADPFLHSCSPRCSQLPARSQPCHSPPARQGINQFSTMD